jgi:uncharacterized coiled-coil protein SlyX
VFLGEDAGFSVSTANNVIIIGHLIGGEDVNNTTWISGIYGVTTQSGTTLPVVVSDDGQLGTAASSARFKKDIQPMKQTSEAILALKPVTFHYKSDAAAVPQFGLVAEEVEKVNPDLVVKDKDGKVFTVRYDAVNVMLLNEFLKEHRKGEERDRHIRDQESTIADLRSRIAQQQKVLATLTARLDQHDAQLQNVNARPELSQSNRQIANNNHSTDELNTH